MVMGEAMMISLGGVMNTLCVYSLERHIEREIMSLRHSKLVLMYWKMLDSVFLEVSCNVCSGWSRNTQEISNVYYSWHRTTRPEFDGDCESTSYFLIGGKEAS